MKQPFSKESGTPGIEIPCPHCGGPKPWSLLQTLNQCRFCGSVLSWPYPEGEPDYLVADSILERPEDLIDVLATYDAMRESSLRRGQLKSMLSENQQEAVYEFGGSDMDVYEIKKERIHRFKFLTSFCVYAPYQLICSLLGFHVLGRISGDVKRFKSMFFTSEDIVPGYSSVWNFRDRGLHLSKNTLRPLASEKQKKTFLATGEVAEEIAKLTRQYTGQRKLLEAEIQPVSFHGSVLDSRRWWVYRPYYFLQASTPDGISWFLMDAQFGTIAGTPSSQEVDRMFKGNLQKLDLQKVRNVKIKVIPFRCPNCGWDVSLRQGIYQFCENCTRLLEPTETGLTVVPYRTVLPDQFSWWPKAHPGPMAWLPFWRFQLTIHLEGKRYQDFSLLMKDLLPALKSLPQRKDYCVPAFDCWTVTKYDEWAFGFGARISEQMLSPSQAYLHESRARKEEVLVPGIPPKLIAALFPRILPLFLPSTAHARFNTLVLNRLAQATVQLHHLELIYVPAPLIETKGSYPKLAGPSGRVEWTPLKEGKWPPVMQRSVKRWKANAHSDQKEKAQGPFSKWLSSS